MRVEGDSYEEAYLRFKDFMHGERPIAAGAGLDVYPPEVPAVYFEVDDQTDYNTIGTFNGDFVKDIVENCSQDLRTKIAHHAVR